jgi:hypothetical protein
VGFLELFSTATFEPFWPLHFYAIMLAIKFDPDEIEMFFFCRGKPVFRIRIHYMRIRFQIQAKILQIFFRLKIFLYVLSIKVTFYKRCSLKYAFKH